MSEQKDLIISTHNPKTHDCSIVIEHAESDKKSPFEILPIGKWASKSLDFIHAPIKTVFDGLRAFSADQKETSDKALKTIDKAINVMEKELEKDLETNERKDIRDKVCRLAEEARKESSESRLFNEGLALLGGSVALVAVGLGIMAFESKREKNEQLEMEES